MTTVVLNSAQELERLQTGKFTETPEIVADNAKQRGNATTTENKGQKQPETPPKQASETTEAKNGAETEEEEDHDGLTAAERKELTEKMQRAIGKRHREKVEAQRFATEQYNRAQLAEQRAAQIEEELAKLRGQQSQQATPVETAKPERANFESDEAYQEAIIDFRVKQQLAKEKQAEAERLAQERQQAIVEAATERLKKAAELVPDFVEVTEAADMRIPGHIAGYMQESEMFAELGYHFAQHPDLVDKLAKLSPARALVEVGKIESTLQPFTSRSAAGGGEKTSKPSNTESVPPVAANGNGAGPNPTESGTAAGPKQSRAPVIKPLNVNSASQVDKPPGEMTYEEARADWEKRKGVHLDRRKRH